MATFEDSGKCKGFAFIDFKDETGPTTALKSKLAKKLINRPLRLEYGEDRSKRTPKRFEGKENRGEEFGEVPTTPEPQAPISAVRRPTAARTRTRHEPVASRMKSSVALATAQRASAAIVPSSGKKIKFD